MDTNLSDTQIALKDMAESFFLKESPLERVREAEDLGFDEELWTGVTKIDLPVLGVADELGGQGGCLVDLVVVAMAYGRALAPIPLIEAMVANRLLSRCGAVVEPDSLDIVTYVPRVVRDGRVRAVPAGAVASRMVTFDGERLLLSNLDGPVPRLSPRNLGSMPLADCAVAKDATVLAEGDLARELHEAALSEWKLLTAAALVGLGQRALEIALDYVKQRKAFGAVIGGFQGVSHPLSNDTVALDGAYLLCLKAAWCLDNETPDGACIAGMAYYHAVESARTATADVVHVHGGIGFTMEADPQLFFRRAKAWPLVCGDPEQELDTIAGQMIQRYLQEA